MSGAPRELIAKLAQIMGDVSRIPKKGHNDHFHYDYVMESDLVEMLRAKLADKKIFVGSEPTKIETVELFKTDRSGKQQPIKLGILHVQYTFYDGENGQSLTLQGVGEIDQDGGKGLYKALTGAMKYFLMKNFLIATGDDPEQTPPGSKATTKVLPRTSASSPPKNRSTDESASKRQLETIGQLAKELKFDPRQWYEERKITSPTKSQASALITSMLHAKKKLARELDQQAAAES